VHVRPDACPRRVCIDKCRAAPVGPAHRSPGRGSYSALLRSAPASWTAKACAPRCRSPSPSSRAPAYAVAGKLASDHLIEGAGRVRLPVHGIVRVKSA
jgi:hypothetical protein